MKMRHPSSILAGLILALATSPIRADGSLPPETARRLKEATVYVKTAFGPLSISGSGFVIEASGDSATIVTNQHVVTKPKILADMGFIPGLRGRDRMALMQIQRTLAANEPMVSVVLNSGEPNEQTVKAEVLCQAEDPDLAVLKITGLKVMPRVIASGGATQPTETMPVFILGFPFGESLAAKNTNPNITIGKGSVSSICKDRKGKVVKVQIDGALNPGNSGGPVVDVDGRLVGVAVQTIQGSNIGLTIPAGEVGTMLAGTLGRVTIVVSPGVNGGPPKYEFVVPVQDPFKHLKSANLVYVLKSVEADPSKAGQSQLDSDGSHLQVKLPVRDPVARAELPLDPKATPPIKQITVQVDYVIGKTISYLDPQVITVPAPLQVATTTDADGKTTTTITQESKDGGRTTRRQTTITRGGSSSSPPADAEKQATFKVGDKVTLTWAGKTETAEVLGINANGWVKVKFPRNGITLTPTLPPAQLKAVAPAKKAAPDATLRVWASHGGKFKVNAKFVELKAGSLTLEKENGENVTVPLDKLGEADQKLARQLAAEAEEDPFAAKPEKK